MDNFDFINISALEIGQDYQVDSYYIKRFKEGYYLKHGIEEYDFSLAGDLLNFVEELEELEN